MAKTRWKVKRGVVNQKMHFSDKKDHIRSRK
jgi:hypothetical protein